MTWTGKTSKLIVFLCLCGVVVIVTTRQIIIRKAFFFRDWLKSVENQSNCLIFNLVVQLLVV